MAIKHAAVVNTSTYPDDGTSPVGTTEWNESHTLEDNTITDASVVAHTTTKITTPVSLITGTLPVANGGTGVTTSTGSGANALATSPTLVTPVLGTPSSGTLTSCTGLPITGITSSTSAEFRTLCSDETGSGLLVFATSPTLTTPLFSGTADLGTNNLNNIKNLIHVLSTTLVALDFADAELQEISIDAATEFTCTGYAVGKSKTVIITNGLTLRTLAFPAGWKFIGSKPTEQAASKIGVLTITSRTTLEAGVIASYGVEE